MNRTPLVQSRRPSLTERIYDKIEQILFGAPKASQQSSAPQRAVDHFGQGPSHSRATQNSLQGVVSGTMSRQGRQASLTEGDSSSVDFLRRIR